MDRMGFSPQSVYIEFTLNNIEQRQRDPKSCWYKNSEECIETSQSSLCCLRGKLGNSQGIALYKALASLVDAAKKINAGMFQTLFCSRCKQTRMRSSWKGKKELGDAWRESVKNA